MRDRRSVDDLSIEELEQILRIKKRQARMERLQRFERTGRRRADVPLPEDDSPVQEPDSEASSDDLPHESYLVQPDQPLTRTRRSLRDRLLLAVEIAAALGLVAVLVVAVSNLSRINQESALVQAAELAGIPTPEPTPLIRAVVLPGGHTPPTAPGGAQPNYAEVPANLRPLVEQQFAGPIIVPTASPAQAIRIRIPSIGVDAPVVQGDGWEQLKKGVGQHLGSANPGENDNVVLSAHNDIYGEIFRNLDQLREGDPIYISTQTREYVYRVALTSIVSPTAVEVMDPTREAVITLISCYPYLVNTDRIVVLGELVDS